HGGRKVDAVAQATKDGYVFVLDRGTGEPLFPVNEVPVPTSPALPGEEPWPTQPVPEKPAPFALQELTEANITPRTPEAHAYVLERFRNSQHGSKYMPPSLEGSLYLFIGGGAEWGGTAADPDGIMYVNSNNMLWWVQMRDVRRQNSDAAVSRGERLFNATCTVCHAANAANKSALQAAQAYPDLVNVGQRLTRKQISAILETGQGRMPSFQHLPEENREAIIDFLLNTASDDIHNPVVDNDSDFPYRPPFLNNGNVQFRDQED